MTELSIIILSYNTRDLLKNCLDSIYKNTKGVSFEIIVSDNASTDGSVEMIKKFFKKVVLVENKKNLGFSKGNNAARIAAKGKYILFLNSDTIVEKDSIKKSLDFLKSDKSFGAVTCRVKLINGEDDKDTRRSFPTPWVSLTHLSQIDRLFPTSVTFAKYWYGYLPVEETHEIDSLQGAFCLTTKEILDKINWFDEDYFLDGEDIDLCFKIHELGFKIMYYPKVNIIHLKGASKGKNKNIEKITLRERIKFATTGVTSMEIFYKKRMWNKYPFLLNIVILLAIRFMKLMRILKIRISYI